MSDKQSSRRKFLQFLGLTAGATIVSKNVFAKGFDHTEIRKLTEKQQEFMFRYEKWMDEFIQVINVQKTEPENMENQKKVMSLSKLSEEFKPELDEHMKDETFAFIFRISIERMTNQIPHI